MGEGIVPKIFGADISENLIEAACKIMLRTAVPEGTWHLSVADAQALKFPGEMFNEIWICGALHQIPIPEKTIDEIARLLLPGGLMFCQTFLEARTILGKRFQLKVAKSGFDFMNREMLDKKLKEKGLTQCGWTESGMTGLFVYRKNAPAFEPSDRSTS
ncbi:MAG: class I SAM-dependent methyltransferase [Desulfobacterium sp.]